MLLHPQRLCTLPGLSCREDKGDNWEALLPGICNTDMKHALDPVFKPFAFSAL